MTAWVDFFRYMSYSSQWWREKENVMFGIGHRLYTFTFLDVRGNKGRGFYWKIEKKDRFYILEECKQK